MITCEECGGEGRVEVCCDDCENAHWHDCIERDGSGEVEDDADEAAEQREVRAQHEDLFKGVK